MKKAIFEIYVFDIPIYIYVPTFHLVDYASKYIEFYFILFIAILGQLELLQQGWPFVMFGDGTMCKCNPIAEYVLV